ncbi:bromodomain-containing protein 8 isoform X3 [Brienomyrus brachyistius]|uniref:bromodomain-containing protein 8 isoform X3 n=1 Tax=Brienomyrus brachyistius TaxID=42636 RepID=UPI0020B2FE93|nr:bromodomain-containing protein 8 isoform X3 [Brienomyrus brachyistius]
MASGVGKHKLLAVGPTEPWSVREKLCLASSVMRSGDQNWVSVSRAIKPFSEPGRPPDWFSQKHCASQYSELLETTEAPKRKRGEKGEVVETVEDVIVRRLTAERIEELKRLLKDTQERYRKLKKEAEMIQAGHLDAKLDELWGEIVQKRKQDEEEAELKRKATDAAYQVRQAAKITPKRAPSLTVRSPGVECPPADPVQPIPEEASSAPSCPGAAVFAPLPEVAGQGNTEATLGGIPEDSPQKKLIPQKATPPPSPLLSELLKKGSLLSASARLVAEGEAAQGLGNGAQRSDPQFVASIVPVPQASAGAPMLSHLLEVGPPPHSPAVTPDLVPVTEVPGAGPSVTETPTPENPAVLDSGVNGAMEVGVPESPLQEEKVEIAEEDLVAVSYMGEELDLETVGDIIAIIEEKVDDSSEVLDDAAVEAALCLCEEAGGGHTLSGPWEPGAFKPIESTHSTPQSPVVSATEPSPVYRGVEAEPEAESGLLEDVPMEDSMPDSPPHPALVSAPPSPPANRECTQSQVSASGQDMDRGAQPEEQEAEPVAEEDGGREQATPSPSIKCEAEEWPAAEGPYIGAYQQDQNGCLQDPPLLSPVYFCVLCLSGCDDSSGSGKECKQEVKEEEAGSDGEEGSVSELKERGEHDGDGEGAYLSELEPAASESEDGYSLNASSLHRYTTADSVPSSPASSQFSVCSEDQEALQAQKIWKKAIMLVWRAAANHRYASVFLQPVSDDIAPGYHSIVHRPMDLSVIKKNIEAGLIRTTAEFQRDIMLMFQNAVMYNSSDHDVYHMALEMQRDVLEQIQQFLATQLIMQTSESGISAKSLRGREAARRQDSSDKDSVPMASPAFLLSLFDGGTRGRRCAIEADLKMKK